MTRRERLEARLERRRQWAEKRRERANAQLNSNPELRHDWAFITQPGHIPARARMNRADDRAFESLGVARHHEAKADGLEHQLERRIFSDDPDAIEQLEAKAAAIDAEVEQWKRINAAFRKAKGVAGWASGLGFSPEGAEKLEQKTRAMLESAPWEKQPIASYQISNTRANARRLRGRIKLIQRRQTATEQAQQAGGVAVAIVGAGYCSITFADKPGRAILDALKAAGFRWSGGSWWGRLSQLSADCLGADRWDAELWRAIRASIEQGEQDNAQS